MSKFPIGQLLKDGAPIVGPEGINVEGMINTEVVRAGLLKDSTAFFDISVSAELYWCGRKDYYRLDKDFGPLRPPFDNIWMEWEVPQNVMIEGKPFELGGRVKNAAMVCVEPVKDFLVVSALLFVLDETTDPPTPIFLPYGHQIGLGEDGCFNGHHCKALVPSFEIPPQVEMLARELSDGNPIWMALNLINCRNVTTRAQGCALTRTTREKRQGVPVKRYHTIVLPGTGNTGSGRPRDARERAAMAQHRVRGHFKTFTAERPLLGKHVGTYWWGWNMRGSKEHGEVISDYRLAAGGEL